MNQLKNIFFEEYLLTYKLKKKINITNLLFYFLK